MRLTLGASVAGFVTLALEVTSVRLLAPSFGARLLVFTSVVGVVLAVALPTDRPPIAEVTPGGQRDHAKGAAS